MNGGALSPRAEPPIKARSIPNALHDESDYTDPPGTEPPRAPAGSTTKYFKIVHGSG